MQSQEVMEVTLYLTKQEDMVMMELCTCGVVMKNVCWILVAADISGLTW